MKIERVIQLAGLMERGNVLPEELAIEFLSEFDGMIQSDIMLHAPEEIVRYDSKDQELILRPPHDGLYLSFLVAMIRQCQGEFEGYNNAQEIVEDKLKTFRRWYIHHYRPADTNSRSYTGGTSGDGFGFAYLSAYGLAAKHGYQGTEEEWLQSLKGEKGDAGAAARMRYDAERDMVQWGVGDEWHDLYTMAEVLAPLYEKLDEMTARAETAAGEAAGHAQAAQTAREQVENVLHDAEGHAREALYQANNAKAAAEKAEQAGDAAETARTKAAELRDETRGLVQDAETAAQVARDEAERAAEAAAAGGVRTGKDAPSSATEGRVGSLYLQTGITPNCLWVCIGADDGVYRWQRCNVYAELDLSDGGDGGVLLVPEGTETQPVLNLYGRHSDENVTLRGVAPAQRDTDAPNLRQVQELIGQGGSGGAGYVASDEPPKDTRALWVDTAEPEEAVALGVTGVETAEGVDLYCTDELGTTTVTVRHGKDGPQGAPGDDGITPHIGDNGNWFIGDTDTGKPSRGAPGDDYVLTPEDKQEIAETAAGMVEVPDGGNGGTKEFVLLYDNTITLTEPVKTITDRLLVSCEDMTEFVGYGSYTANLNTETGNDRMNFKVGKVGLGGGQLEDPNGDRNFMFKAEVCGDRAWTESIAMANGIPMNGSYLHARWSSFVRDPDYSTFTFYPYTIGYQGTITLKLFGR